MRRQEGFKIATKQVEQDQVDIENKIQEVLKLKNGFDIKRQLVDNKIS